MSEKRLDYWQLVKPAVDKAITLMIESESKHVVGLKMSDDDALKCARHAISSQMGETNPDGQSHAVAALARAIKMVLNE